MFSIYSQCTSIPLFLLYIYMSNFTMWLLYFLSYIYLYTSQSALSYLRENAGQSCKLTRKDWVPSRPGKPGNSGISDYFWFLNESEHP